MAEDAVKVAPHVYRVIMENDRVRVLDTIMKPGGRTAMHSHPAVVPYAISAGKYKFTSPDGHSMEAELEAGQAMYLDAVDHSTENVGATEGHIILVELK